MDVARLQDDDRRSVAPVRQRGASASARIRPCSSTGYDSGAPSPRKRSGRSTVSCRSAPTSTRTRGPPARPVGRTSQPARRSTASRPAASAGEVRRGGAGHEPDRGLVREPEQVEQPGGRDVLHRGVRRGEPRSPQFWSQALTSQSAASAAGCVPPITKPKKRPLGIAGEPGRAGLRELTTTMSGRRSGPAGRHRADGRPRRRWPAAAPDGRPGSRASRASRWATSSAA